MDPLEQVYCFLVTEVPHFVALAAYWPSGQHFVPGVHLSPVTQVPGDVADLTEHFWKLEHFL